MFWFVVQSVRLNVVGFHEISIANSSAFDIFTTVSFRTWSLIEFTESRVRKCTTVRHLFFYVLLYWFTLYFLQLSFLLGNNFCSILFFFVWNKDGFCLFSIKWLSILCFCCIPIFIFIASSLIVFWKLEAYWFFCLIIDSLISFLKRWLFQSSLQSLVKLFRLRCFRFCPAKQRPSSSLNDYIWCELLRSACLNPLSERGKILP